MSRFIKFSGYASAVFLRCDACGKTVCVAEESTDLALVHDYIWENGWTGFKRDGQQKDICDKCDTEFREKQGVV